MRRRHQLRSPEEKYKMEFLKSVQIMTAEATLNHRKLEREDKSIKSVRSRVIKIFSIYANEI